MRTALNNHSFKGYTLIELVVALAILALASLLMIEGARMGTHAWAAVNARLTRVDAIAVAQSVLRLRLQQLYPYRPSRGAPENAYALVGHPADMSFSAPGPRSAPGEMLRYRIYLQPHGATADLKIAWREDTGTEMTDGGIGGWRDESLLDDVADLRVDYLARSENGAGAWTSTWSDQMEPPTLVRVRLKLVHGAVGDWPELVVRPRIDVPADCRFDPVSRKCRET